ncbi:hypothetical protein AB0D11_17845 [Streptomyces monashensis]|uniref:hypothetical protein n=1 Tax=Streptomyces monashensis TaxID=1678012 RepID=UPI0033F1A988
MHRLIPSGEAARPAASPEVPERAPEPGAALIEVEVEVEVDRFGRASRTPATLDLFDPFDPFDLCERRILGKAVLLTGEER